MSAIDSFEFKKMNNICLFVISVRIIVYVHVMTKTDGYVVTVCILRFAVYTFSAFFFFFFCA